MGLADDAINTLLTPMPAYEAEVRGAARGLSFGLSDLAIAKLAGEQEKQKTAALREQYPGLSTASEVAGNIAGALLPIATPARGAALLGETVARQVGASALGRIGTTTVGKAAARALGLAVGGSVEGGLMGAGETISEGSLGDPEHVGEILASNVSRGALFGFLGGGALGFVGDLAGTAFRKLRNRAETGISRAINQDAPIIARQASLRALGLTDRQAAMVMPQKLDHAIDVLHDPSLLPDGAIIRKGDDITATVNRAGDAVTTVGKRLDATRVAADDVTKMVDEIQAAGEAGYEAEVSAAAEQTGATQKAARRLQGTEDELTLPAEPPPPVLPGKAIDLSTDTVNTRKLAQEIREKAKRYYAGLNDDAIKMGVDVAEADVPANNRPAFRFMNQEADRIEQSGPYWSQKKAQFEKQAAARNVKFSTTVEESVRGEASRHIYDSINHEQDRALESLLTKIDAPDVVQGYKADKAAYAALRDVSDIAENQLWKQTPDAYMQEVGKFGADVFRGIAWRMIYSGRGPVAAVRTALTAGGIRGVADVVSAWVAPSRVATWAHDAASLRLLQKRVLEYADRVQKAVDAIVSGGKIARPGATRVLLDITGERDDVSAYKTVADQIRDLPSDKLVQRIAMATQGLETAAPQTAVASSQALARAAQIIQSVFPPALQPQSLQPFLEDQTPTADEISRLRAVLGAVVRPETVLQDIAQGKIDPRAVEVVQLVYPQMLDGWRRAIATQAATSKTQLPYGTRVQLSLLFGVPTDPTLDPAFVQRSQLAWAPQRPVGEKQGSAPKLSDDAERRIFGKNSMTGAQRLEAGMMGKTS